MTLNYKFYFIHSYKKLVKETMHRAYFDILREQLESDPPVYNQALVLLEDVKQVHVKNILC